MNNVAPQVSVIVPVFNRVRVVGRAIDSALAQSVHDLEVIVVDDASTDGTRAIVEAYTDTRVKYLRHEKNMYAAAARNTGMSLAQGDYIAFLDSDDEWLPEKLRLQIGILEQAGPDWGCVYGGARIFKNVQPNAVVYRPLKEGELLREFLTSQIVIWTPTFLFRRECLDVVGSMDVALKRSEDRDFYIRMLSHYKLAKIGQPVANIFLDTMKPLADVSLAYRQMLLNKHRHLLDELGWVTRRHAYGIQWMLQAEQYFVEKRPGMGLLYVVKSLAKYPFLPLKRYLAMAYKLGKSVWPAM